MATWDDVARTCLALPEVVEQASGHGGRQWRVRDKTFVWERPLRRKDLAELGDAAPDGPALAAYVPDEGHPERFRSCRRPHEVLMRKGAPE